jgi:protein ImuB
LTDPELSDAGIMAGQTANAALALKPDIELVERSPLREQQTLEAVAGWLEQFSSCVSIAGPDVLVLEIAGSLRLFGGLRALRRQIAVGLDAQGFSAGLAITPTPLSATWLARHGQRACIRDAANLLPALRRLPLECLDWSEASLAALHGMGIQTVGDCLRLPRDGFARRFGSRRLIQLDQAMGRLPDPRTAWRAPERFTADFEVTEEQSDRELLLAMCGTLLERQERFLLARQQGVQRIRLRFFHLRASATLLEVGGAETARARAHWLELVRIRFEQLVLPEPVIAVRLEAGQGQELKPGEARLVLGDRPARTQRYSKRQLAERLAARLGDEHIHGVTAVAEHRPHYAWRVARLLADEKKADVVTPPGRARRPLWMLPEPEPLAIREGYPWHEGRLSIMAGPERLETGWWDEDGISRDYYEARNPRGRRLWVFRARQRRGADADYWYLHGYFG